jgi:MFS family permease
MVAKIRSPLFLMALTVFIDFVGFGLALPLLPFWAERLGANALGVGLVLTVFALAQFIFTPILGTLGDRHGRRPVIVISIGLQALAFAATALASTLPLLLLARFMGGLGASNIGSAQAVVADTTAPQDRARGMGVIGAAIGIGFVVGPALASLLASVGPTVPFWVAMGLALGNALLVFRFLPETHNPTRALSRPMSVGLRAHGDVLLAGWRRMLRSPIIARLVMINLLFTLAFAAMETVFPLLGQRTFGWHAQQIGGVLAYVGVLLVIMQGGLVGRLVKQIGERALLLAGLLLLALGLLLLPFSRSVPVLLLAFGMLGIGYGAISPTVSSLLSLGSPRDSQGETLGLSQGIAGLGRVVGPLAAGALYGVISPAAPFIGGGLLVLLAGLVALPLLA